MKKITQKEMEAIVGRNPTLRGRPKNPVVQEVIKLNIHEILFVPSSEWKLISPISTALANYRLKYNKDWTTIKTKEGWIVERTK